MAGLGVGDLAQSLGLRRQNAQLKAELNRLSLENASGKAADLTRAVAGDHRASAALNRSLTGLAAYKTVTAEAGLLTDAAQTSASAIQSLLTERYPAAISAGGAGSAAALSATAAEARTAFASAVSALNAQAGGRPVFSGTGTATPLPPAEDLLSQIAAATATATTAAGLEAAVTAWFDDPVGGYRAAYAGAADPLAPFAIGEDATAAMTVTALDPAVKASLRGLAMAALATGGNLGTQETADLMTRAGEVMANAADDMTALSVRIGLTQARIEDAATGNSAQASTLKIALAKLTEVDAYDSATLLTATEGQQQMLYTVTSRLSALSLLDYLR